MSWSPNVNGFDLDTALYQALLAAQNADIGELAEIHRGISNFIWDNRFEF